jgi:hypothetical protein
MENRLVLMDLLANFAKISVSLPLFAYDSLSCFSKSDSDLVFSLFLYDEYEIVLPLIITFIVSHNNWSFIETTMPNLTLDDGRVIEDIKLILSEQK